jgi:Rieske Fe-S protein
MERQSFLTWAKSLLGRRSFLKWTTNGLGALVGAALGIPAIGYLLDPRNRPAPPGAFRRVGRVSELTANVPKAAVIRDIRVDAWTLHPNDVIGRVWLIRRPEADDNGQPKVEAYTKTCPHLGGSINFDEQKKCFVCPLHGATFDAQCRRVSEDVLGRANPAPRDMDTLEAQLVPDPNRAGDYFIEVKYENFMQGLPTKVKKA